MAQQKLKRNLGINIKQLSNLKIYKKLLAQTDFHWPLTTCLLLKSTTALEI
jgi:hypothetical protein